MAEQIPASEMGMIDVLNTGAGHKVIKFDGTKAEQVEKAKTTITDLLKKGYMLVVDDGKGGHKKVKKFDAKIDSYIVQGVPAEADEAVPRTASKATAIAPTAGG